MNQALSELLVIQDRDSKIEFLSQELKRIPAERQRIIQHGEQRKEGLLKSKKDLQDTEVAIKNLELETESRRASIRKLKTQQMETRKNEEYQAFERELGRLDKDVDELETQQLALMDQLDVYKENYAKAELRHKEVEKTIDGELASVDEKAANLKKELDELEKERAVLVAPMDEDILARYERMRSSKGLPVVVQLNDAGQCAGCYTSVVRSTEARVRSGQEIVECENCGRFLY